MTIPFNVPDVKPLYLDTSRVQSNGFHERLKTFLGVLQQREDNAVRERELRNQELAKMEQAQAGALLAQMVTGMDTQQVPGMTVPTGLPGGVGPSVTMAPQTFEGPLAKALKSQPGSVVYEALGRGNNLVTQYFNDRDKRLAAKPPVQRKPDPGQLTDAEGYALSWDKTTNRAVNILDEQGNRVRLKIPGQDGTGSEGRWADSGYKKNGIPQQYNTATGQFRDAPGGRELYLKSTPAIEHYKAAQLYAESANDWQSLRELGFPSIPTDMSKFVLAAREAVGENGEFLTYLAQTTVYDETTKQAIRTYVNLAMNALYQKSGAAISVKEMQQILSKIPFASDGTEAKQRKLRAFRTGIEAQFRTGIDVLERSAMENGMPYIKPYDLFNDDPGADAQSGLPLLPGDPYQSGGSPAKPFSLQRPR